MSEQELETGHSRGGTNRRQFIKAAGATTAIAALGIPSVSIGTVEATESGEIEITTVADFNEDTADVYVTVMEFDDDGEQINEQTVSIDSGENTYVLDELEGGSEYDFEVELGSDDDEVDFESLTLEIPEGIEYEFKDHTSDDWEIDVESRDIEIYYDEFRLRKYQPKLVMDQDTRRRFKGLFGYVAESENEDTFVCCYWMQKTHQDGLPIINKDSHLGDHEPIYVFVDEDSEDVETIVYTGYHWYASEITPENTLMTSDRAADETHANFEVIDPWHHFSRVPTDGTHGAFFELKSWPEHRDSWMDNGFYDPAQPEAIEDPWTMMERDGWWRDGSFDKRMASVWRVLGLRGGDQTDGLRAEGEQGHEGKGTGIFPSLPDWVPFTGGDNDD